MNRLLQQPELKRAFRNVRKSLRVITKKFQIGNCFIIAVKKERLKVLRVFNRSQ